MFALGGENVLKCTACIIRGHCSSSVYLLYRRANILNWLHDLQKKTKNIDFVFFLWHDQATPQTGKKKVVDCLRY